MTTAELAYPVLEIDRCGHPMVSTDEDVLTTSNSATIKRGAQTGFTIIDSGGRAFRVTDTRFICGKGRFWGYTIWLDRVISVELVLSDPRDMELEDVKETVLRCMRHGATSVDAAYWRRQVMQVKDARSVREIIDLILPHYDKREFIQSLR